MIASSEWSTVLIQNMGWCWSLALYMFLLNAGHLRVTCSCSTIVARDLPLAVDLDCRPLPWDWSCRMIQFIEWENFGRLALGFFFHRKRHAKRYQDPWYFHTISCTFSILAETTITVCFCVELCIIYGLTILPTEFMDVESLKAMFNARSTSLNDWTHSKSGALDDSSEHS